MAEEEKESLAKRWGSIMVANIAECLAHPESEDEYDARKLQQAMNFQAPDFGDAPKAPEVPESPLVDEKGC